MNIAFSFGAWLFQAAFVPLWPVQESTVHCTWREGEHLAVLEGLRAGASPQARRAVVLALVRHGMEHGWDELGRDLSATSVRCDPQALESTVESAASSDSWFAMRLIAEALERNGRSEVATKLLLGLRERTCAKSNGGRCAGRSIDRKLAYIALRSKDYEQALPYFERFKPTLRCGSCAMSQDLDNARAEAQCLVGLDRWEDLAVLCRERTASGEKGGMCFAEYLLDAAYRRGDADPVLSVRLALDIGPEEEPALQRVFRHWNIRRMPHAEAVEWLIELLEGRGHWDEASAILRSCPEGVSRWVHVFEKPEKERSWAEQGMVRLLAETGEGCLEAAVLEEARKSRHGELLLKEWQRARRE